jgi:S-adenosylmethionine synthetase
MPSSWNATFKDQCDEILNRELDRCLPKDERSKFVAEVTLDKGNVVQKG